MSTTPFRAAHVEPAALRVRYGHPGAVKRNILDQDGHLGAWELHADDHAPIDLAANGRHEPILPFAGKSCRRARGMLGCDRGGGDGLGSRRALWAKLGHSGVLLGRTGCHGSARSAMTQNL